MDLAGINSLEKDPFDYIPKEDPFWTDVLSMQSADDVGDFAKLAESVDLEACDMDCIASSNLCTMGEQLPQLQVPFRQQLHDLEMNGASMKHVDELTQWKGSQNCNTQQLNDNTPDMLQTTSFSDPDQFFTQFFQHSAENGHTVQHMNSDQCKDNSSQQIFSDLKPESIETIKAASISEHPSGTYIQTIPVPNLSPEVSNFEVNGVKKEHSGQNIAFCNNSSSGAASNVSPMNIVIMPKSDNVQVKPVAPQANGAKEVSNARISSNVHQDQQNVIDVKSVLDLITSTSKAEHPKVDQPPPNVTIPPAMIKLQQSDYVHQVLQQLGQYPALQTMKAMQKSQPEDTGNVSTLQNLLQSSTFPPKENSNITKGNNKNSINRVQKAPNGTQKLHQKLTTRKLSSGEDIKHEVKATTDGKTNGISETPQLSQLVITPQLIYSSGDSTKTIPVNVTNQAPIHTSTTNPGVVATATLPIILSTSVIETTEKVPIKRLRLSNVVTDNEAKPKGKGEKVERRSNHNLVEKKYRMSINACLGELKELVMGSGTKSTKSGILRMAIEKIKELKKVNKRLQMENTKLRMSLKNLSLEEIISMAYSEPERTKCSKRKRKGSYSSSDGLSDDQTDVEFDQDQEEHASHEDTDEGISSANSPGSESSDSGRAAESSGRFGMLDRTRVCLWIFLFTFMIFSPFQSILSGKGTTDSGHFNSRVLLAEGNNWVSGQWPLPQTYSLIFIHAILGLLIYVWILLKGEPTIPVQSKQRKYCSRLIAEAKSLIQQRRYPGANARLEECLLIMGRPLPVSRLDIIFGFIWNLGSFVTIQLGFMKIFKAIGWRILPGRKSPSQNKEELEFSCNLAASAYLLLHDLSWIDSTRRQSGIRRALLLLKAVNMVEMAGGQCPHKLYVKTYANVALDISSSWKLFRMQVMDYFVNQALRRHRLAPRQTLANISFIFHPAVRRFLKMNKKAVQEKMKSCERKQDFSLSEIVGKQFCLSQANSILRSLVVHFQGNSSLTVYDKAFAEVSIIGQCFPTTSSDKSYLASDKSLAAFTTWWYTVLYYLVQVAHLTPDEQIQGILLLAKLKDENRLEIRHAVATALRTAVMVTLGLKQPQLKRDWKERNLEMVEKTIRELRLISEESRNGKEEFSELEKICIVNSCELLLSGRFQLWEESEDSYVSATELDQAEMCLDFMQYFDLPGLKPKVKSYSTLLRYLSGCNPVDIMKNLQYNQCYSASRRKDGLKKEDLMDNQMNAFLLVSGGGQLLKSGVTHQNKVQSTIKKVESAVEGTEHLALRARCSSALTYPKSRGS